MSLIVGIILLICLAFLITLLCQILNTNGMAHCGLKDCDSCNDYYTKDK